MRNETKVNTLLSNMSKKNAFNVPEGYFEELPMAVLSKCSVSKVKKGPFLALKPLWWSVAACSFLLLGIWFVVPNTTPSSDSLLTGHEFYAEDIWTDYLAQRVCPLIIEEELFASNAEFTPFFDELTNDAFWVDDDFSDLFDIRFFLRLLIEKPKT